ncbi:MAG: DegT/DnrJ/EryC1/StrS family aminotransferase [Nanoarchaeota archaeon]
MPNPIKWWVPEIGKEEHKYIKEVLDSSFPNEGPMSARFEQEICKLVNCKHAVVVTSCTAAIYVSLKALGVGHGDEVIVPDITFIATANAVEMTGAKPVLVDVNKEDLNISAKSFRDAISKKTKAVVPVHVTGRAAPMEEIIEIAKKNNVHVVEDAAEALMSKHNNKYLGTFGATGCFSFSAHKTITMGQGGVIVTNDDALHKRLIEIKDHGRPVRGTGGDDMHNSIGYNFKFTDLQAAVGLGQLHYLDKRVKRQAKINEIYRKGLEGVKGIKLFDFDIKNGEVPQWTDAIVEKRDDLDSYLLSKKIICRRFWHPIHTQKPYRLPDDKFPNSTSLSKKALWLPSAFTLSDEDINEVCSHIRKFLK